MIKEGMQLEICRLMLAVARCSRDTGLGLICASLLCRVSSADCRLTRWKPISSILFCILHPSPCAFPFLTLLLLTSEKEAYTGASLPSLVDRDIYCRVTDQQNAKSQCARTSATPAWSRESPAWVPPFSICLDYHRDASIGILHDRRMPCAQAVRATARLRRVQASTANKPLAASAATAAG